ncbi:hypothetical protein GWI33_009959 [Rhynchophorus ferrugineus]|uniref:Uncharacterized protein n=1 Tax=Rhynchophorus ferrugineus TaxID=354439 RepID=A0A834IR32_RHYFE|nr:hypothetical protein GWI33_009959 [Rhynchophorus ferrugineus]
MVSVRFPRTAIELATGNLVGCVQENAGARGVSQASAALNMQEGGGHYLAPEWKRWSWSERGGGTRHGQCLPGNAIQFESSVV